MKHLRGRRIAHFAITVGQRAIRSGRIDTSRSVIIVGDITAAIVKIIDDSWVHWLRLGDRSRAN